MRTGTNGAADDRLREAQRQWELWRLRCRRPGWIPTDLWLLAAEAAAELGVEPTARKLRLNSERLEEWGAQWERTRRPAESDGTAFAELPPVPYYEGRKNAHQATPGRPPGRSKAGEAREFRHMSPQPRMQHG